MLFMKMRKKINKYFVNNGGKSVYIWYINICTVVTLYSIKMVYKEERKFYEERKIRLRLGFILISAGCAIGLEMYGGFLTLPGSTEERHSY